MSVDLIARNNDLQRLIDEGFSLEIRGGYLLVHNVPYVRTDGLLDRGILVTSLALTPTGETVNPISDHTMYLAGGMPCHRDGKPLKAIVNNSTQKQLLTDLVANHYLSSKPEGGQPYADNYDKVTAYERHLAGAARSVDPTANARSGHAVNSASVDHPFSIPDTAASRYQIGDIAAKLKLDRVKIIGLGGTGAHVLDLLAKCPIQRIDLYDGKQLFNHTLFRAPGAPVPEFLKNFPLKVDYYASVYGRLHNGIVAHGEHVTVENIDHLHDADFVFVCVDKGSARRAIAEGLHRLGVPFIDTGIGMGRDESSLDGVSRVTFIEPEMSWEEIERLLPFGDDDNLDEVYGAAIQAGDLNSLNAVLAVFRFKRWLSYYRDSIGETNSSFMLEGNLMANRRRKK